jgi:hypothetical protein
VDPTDIFSSIFLWVIVVLQSLNTSFYYDKEISGDALDKEWSAEKTLCACLISRTQNITAGGCKELCLRVYSANNMYTTRFYVAGNCSMRSQLL